MVSSILTCASASMPRKRIENLAVDRFDRVLHALAEIALLVAVAQLDGLMRAGRGAGRHAGAAARAVLQHDVDLDGGIAAAVENFAADNVDDGGHVRAVMPAPDLWVLRGFYRIGEPLVMPCQSKACSVRMAKKPLQLGRPAPLPASPDQAVLDRVRNPHPGHELCRALHLSRIHRDVPGHRPAGFRHAGHRLCAEGLARRIEIAEALSQQLPQSRRVPRGLHGRESARSSSRC